jgi:hypothetical protein
MKKILILIQSPFLKRDYDRFGIDVLKKNFDIKVLDFSSWIRPGMYRNFKDKIFYSEEYNKIKNRDIFLGISLDPDPLLIFDFLDRRPETAWIRDKLKNKKNTFVHFNINLVPINTRFKRKITKLLYMIKSPKSLFLYIRDFIEFKFYKYKYLFIPDIIVTGGMGMVPNKQKNIKKIINAHCLDYDIYLKIKDKPIDRSTKYAVFIDQALTSHPDYIIKNIKPSVTEKSYFPQLNNFFKILKKETNLDIKFATHPMSQDEKLPLLLKDINFHKSNTAELIKNSSLVLGHNSTALSFAVLFKKPIINLTSEELKKSWLGPEIETSCKSSGGKMIYMDKNINKQINLDELLKIDEAKYKKFKDNYLKVPHTPDIPLWEIVSNNLIN